MDTGSSQQGETQLTRISKMAPKILMGSAIGVPILGILLVLLSRGAAPDNSLTRADQLNPTAVVSQAMQQPTVRSTFPTSTVAEQPASTIRPTVPVVQPTARPIEWRVLSNTTLGFSIWYPSAWGEAKETIHAVKKEENPFVEAGSVYYLEFSGVKHRQDYSYPYAIGRSPDYRTTRPLIDDFMGDKTTTPKVRLSAYDSPSSCHDTAFLGAKPYEGFINITIPGKPISAIRFVLPLLSDKDTDLFDGEYENVEDEARPCNGEVEAEALLQKLEKRKLDAQSRRNIAIFREMSQSVHFP